MFYGITREINYAILIEEEDLKKLLNLISKKYKEVEIIANFKDKTKLKTNNIQKIIAFSNDNFKKIISLSIYARNSSNDSLSLHIGIELFSNRVATFLIEAADEEDFNFIKNKLENWFIGLRQWYDYLSKIEIWNFSSLLVIFSILSLWVFAQFKELYKSTDFIITVIKALIVVSFLLGIILLVFSKPISNLQKYIFPRIFFSIGKQKSNLNTLKNIRLGIATSLIIAFIIELFTKVFINFINFLIH